eukprot:3593639-Prymnesium_polylepis.1
MADFAPKSKKFRGCGQRLDCTLKIRNHFAIVMVMVHRQRHRGSGGGERGAAPAGLRWRDRARRNGVR